MKRKGFISKNIETKENFKTAFDGFADGKHKRSAVRKFEANLDDNLNRLLREYVNGTWHTSEYIDEVIHEVKRRTISKVPVDDHVIQWAACNFVEPILTNTYIRNSCSCVKGRGTHDFNKLLAKDLYLNPEDTYYFVQLDAHHFFQSISHVLMKERIRTKIKDPKLLAFLDEFISSYKQGLPLGVKISQILANFFLAKFDHDAMKLFCINDDPEKMAYWRARFVSDSLVSCRTESQAKELAKGVVYLNKKFDDFVDRGLVHYYRFADNIVVLHSDKTFLHLVTEMMIMVLARDYLIQVNSNWNVRPVYAGGIDVCGYVFFHDHVRLRKRNKKALCKQVAKCKKKGLSPEETRRKCASRIGFAIHANCNNLLKNLDINMEKRLGTVIKNRKVNIPFKGMRYDQKRTFSEIVCKNDNDEDKFKILLIDFVEDDSIIEKETVINQVPDGNGGVRTEQIVRPKKRLAIRYKQIVSVNTTVNDEGEEVDTYEFVKEVDKKTGQPTGRDAEWYSYSGSSVMLDQAGQDFTREDLPCLTVVKEFCNKQGKKFLKFT